MKSTLTVRIIGAAIGATLATGAVVSIADAAGKSGTIHGCVGKKGALRVVKSASKCTAHEHALSWNKRGPAGPAGAPAATKIFTLDPGEAASNGSDTRAFLGTPATVTVANAKTALLVTASLDFAPASTGQIDSFFEVCYKHGSSSIHLVSYVEPNFTANTGNYFAQAVVGAVSNLPAGVYKVGVCSAAEVNVLHGHGTGTVQVMQTTSGVSAAS